MDTQIEKARQFLIQAKDEIQPILPPDSDKSQSSCLIRGSFFDTVTALHKLNKILGYVVE